MTSRDFLGRFGRESRAQGDRAAGSAAGAESDDIELSLGLSLGGCFGRDPAREDGKPSLLARSSSIASICSMRAFGGGEVAAAAEPQPAAPLMRTSSLPTEPEVDRFRRRELQCQRRLAAKRKRLERRNSMNSGRSSAGGSARDDAPEPTYPTGFQLRPNVASQGSTSSSVAEQDAKPFVLGAGGAGGTEAKSPSAMNTSSDNTSGHSSSLPPTPPSTGSGRPPTSGAATRGEQQQQQPVPLGTLKSLAMRTASTGDLRKSMMEDMPMVSSRVDGPNGRKIDGFLYKYRKGEEVRIVCVCHGSFLTPAEFVRHAGGSDDVANPLRHIVVNPQPSLFL